MKQQKIEATASDWVEKWKKVALNTNRVTEEEAKEFVDYLYETVMDIKTVPVILVDGPVQACNVLAEKYSCTPGTLCKRFEQNNKVHNLINEKICERLFYDLIKAHIPTDLQQVSNLAKQMWDKSYSFLTADIVQHIAGKWQHHVAVPYIKGVFDACDFVGFEYFNQVELSLQLKKDWDWLQTTIKFGFIYAAEDFCIVIQKPTQINLSQSGKLHGDGKPAVAWADGSAIYCLNGVYVPKELALTPSQNLNVERWLANTNVDVRAEFIRKYGIEGLMKKYGKVVDTWENHTNAKNYEWYKKSEYKLIDMSALFKAFKYLPYLYMKNQSVPGVYHLECVYNPNVKRQPHTIIQGLKVRLNGTDPEKLEITAIK